MKSIHQPEIKQEIIERARKLSANTQRKWGVMTVEQMLWHISSQLKIGIGEVKTIILLNKPIRWITKWFVGFTIPWTRNLPTAKEMKNPDPASFEIELDNFLVVLDIFTSKPANFRWQPHPIFGDLTKEEWGKIAYKHIDHHLTQFGV